MKLFILFIFFHLCHLCANSQIFKARAKILLIKYNTGNTIPIKSNIDLLARLDTTNKQFKLFNPDKTFDIIKFEKVENTKFDNTKNYEYLMIDNDGIKCMGDFMVSKDGLESFSISYSNMSYNYLAKPIKN